MPHDGMIISSMGIDIAIVWVFSAALMVQRVRPPATDRSLAMEFRIGLSLNIVGARWAG